MEISTENVDEWLTYGEVLLKLQFLYLSAANEAEN